jgi:putative ABC transport system substrate-binding protein
MRRREFITLLCGAAVWPLPARAQVPGKPVIGFLNAASAQGYERQLAAFLMGLAEMGFVDGQNVTIGHLRFGPIADILQSEHPAMARKRGFA